MNKKTKGIRWLASFLILCMLLSIAPLSHAGAENEVVYIPDPNLEQVIRDQLNKQTGDITKEDMERIYNLRGAEAKGIEYLTGLEYAVNLRTFWCSSNNVGDISPLANLTNLEDIRLGSNQISDINSLANLTNLRSLRINNNQISDISALANLINLSTLLFTNNQVSDISALANLINLRDLRFTINQVSDISVLENLTKLRYLYFSWNEVSDISALVNLTNLQGLSICSNQINDISALANLTNLTSLSFCNIQITDISPLANLMNLTYLHFEANQVSDISVLVNLIDLERLYFGVNRVGDISAIENLTNLIKLRMPWNYLDISEGSETMLLIQQLIDDGVDVEYIPQREQPDDQSGRVVLLEPLGFTHGPYIIGDTLTASFRIKNDGDAAITLDKLLLGGRFNGGELPGGGYPDFPYQSVTLQPGETHLYEGTYTLPEPGNYEFFIAYYIENPTEAEKEFLDENNWNTAIELGEGLTDADRKIEIQVGPTSGTHKVAYIPVRYSDGTVLQSSLEDVLKVRASLVEKYYEMQSYGEINIVSHFYDEVELDKPESNWKDTKEGIDDYFRSVMTEANILPDDYDFKTNLEGYDAILVISPDLGVTPFANFVAYPQILNMAYVEETDRSEREISYGTWAHELGHALFNWLDYYSRENYVWTRGSIGFRGLMGAGTKINPPAPIMSFHKVEKGWLHYSDNPLAIGDEITIKLLHEMQPGDPVYRYKPDKGEISYFIIEGRYPPDGLGNDMRDDGFLPYDELIQNKGILLYEVREKEDEIEGNIGNTISQIDVVPFFHLDILGKKLSSDANRVTLDPSYALLNLDYDFTYKCSLSEVKFIVSEVDSELRLKIESHVPFSTRIKQLAVTGIAPALSRIFPPSPLYTENEFDIDLKVHTEDGLMVGMDYVTGDYRVEIPGAGTSGNRMGGGPEWISVPDDIEVYYEINTTPMELWLNELVERGIMDTADLEGLNRMITVTVQDILVDEFGERTTTEITITSSPPFLPSEPWPLDGATGADLELELRWSSGDPDPDDEVIYDIFFGTDEIPLFKETIGPFPADQSTLTFNPGLLEPNSTYYWRIVARDNYGITVESPTWSFMTGSEATGTGSINHVVLEIDTGMVIFTIGAYGSALAAGPGDELYDYMASGGVPVVRAVGSGDKFIGIGAYGTAFAQEGDTAGAIAAAPAQSWETTSAYLVFEGFDAGEPVLTPLFP